MYQTAFHTHDIKNMRFLVTGGAGFVGSHLVEYLIRYGALSVRVLDNLSTGSEENIQHFINNPSFEFIEGDITDLQVCQKACEGVDFVLHQAALGSVPRSVKNPIATNNANVNGFLNMLIASRDNNVRRFVYASSSSVYGDSMHLPKKEEHIGNPLSPYAVSKKVNELYASVFAQTYRMEILGLRYFNIFGPRQRPDGPYAAVIPLFMKAALTNENPDIHGDGLQSRDFTFVENAVEANIKALFAPIHDINGTVFNIALGEQTTVNELFSIITQEAQSQIKPNYQNEREGDVKHSLADITKAREFLNYNPAIKIQEGLQITFDWFKSKYIHQLS